MRPVSKENLDLVRAGIKDVNAFWEMLDEYVIWDLRAARIPDLDSIYMGRDAVIKASRHYWGTWDGYRLDVEELKEIGPIVFVLLREFGRGKTSGAPFDKSHAQLWTFRSGRVIRWESFATRAEALEAAAIPKN